MLTTERGPHRDPGWLVMHYVLAVITVAVLLCLGQVLVQRELLQQVEVLRQTEAVHDQLLLTHRMTHATPELNLHFQDEETDLELRLAKDAEARTLLERAQPEVAVMIAGLRDGRSGERETLALELVRQSFELLVVHLNRTAESRLLSLRWIELGILGLVMLTLTAESLLVFRPAAQEIHSLFGELEATRLLLSKRLKRLNESHATIKADLKSAAEVQRALLPKDAPEVPGYSFAWSFRASHDVAGDMFNLIRLDENHVAIYVLDVSGHGVPAALLSVSLSRVITANLGSLLKKRLPEAPFYQLTRPSEVARELNRRFPVMSESDQFFTLIYGIIDTRTNIFTFVQAGHPGPILVSPTANRTWETAPDPPIGIIDEVEFTETQVQLKPGDMLYLYTDGVIEARDPQGEMYGLTRVIDSLAEHRAYGVSACLEELYDSMRNFTNGQPQKDDLTLVACQFIGTAEPPLAPAAAVTGSGRYRSVPADP